MRTRAILITGAVGEIGQALIKELAQDARVKLLTLDLKALPPKYESLATHVQGDILDRALLSRLISEYEFEAIFHLAALLSTRAEFTPAMAHRVNVDGTMQLMQLAAEQSERSGESVRFIFPSSIAAYGLPDLKTKASNVKVREWEWNYPTTMYGCNKLYCELLGQYFSRHYLQLAAKRPQLMDFRCLRLPGLISANTIPSGGTSDYAPEMLHASAVGEPYDCFVRQDTCIPFMAMPDAITALLAVGNAPASSLTKNVYNVRSFSLSAAEIREQVLRAFPQAQIRFRPDARRQRIVDSWPADVDDSAARRDWGWQPAYDAQPAFDDYLVPNIQEFHQRQ